jgi:hypothetical protein
VRPRGAVRVRRHASTQPAGSSASSSARRAAAGACSHSQRARAASTHARRSSGTALHARRDASARSAQHGTRRNAPGGLKVRQRGARSPQQVCRGVSTAWAR